MPTYIGCTLKQTPIWTFLAQVSVVLIGGEQNIADTACITFFVKISVILILQKYRRQSTAIASNTNINKPGHNIQKL